MVVKKVVIKPLEPLMLRSQGEDVNIYGTLVESNESYFYPLRMGNLFALIDSNTLCSLPKIFESTGESYEKWEKEIYDIFYSEKNKLFELINFQDRVGISLDRGRTFIEVS